MGQMPQSSFIKATTIGPLLKPLKCKEARLLILCISTISMYDIIFMCIKFFSCVMFCTSYVILYSLCVLFVFIM